MRTDGLILAAGEGRRFGLPKVLVPGALESAVDVLHSGGCCRVTVVLGAEAERAATLVPSGVRVRIAEQWATGMGSALRTGLAGFDRGDRPDAVLIHLIDLPDVGPDVVRRLLAFSGPDALARAAYRGVPGHPVLLGREHFVGAAAAAIGDRGARNYLAERAVVAVECGDLATGDDVDFPPPGFRPPP